MIHMIAAIAKNQVIGYKGAMPWHLPEDLQHFKERTTGAAVIMGRKTYDSIGKALPDRQNIVISRTIKQLPDCLVVSSLEQAILSAEKTEIFVIGGAQIYTQALPLADYLDLTWVDAEPQGDTFFPTVNWADFIELERIVCSGSPAYQFVTYKRKSKNV